jgi:hypothetical protein
LWLGEGQMPIRVRPAARPFPVRISGRQVRAEYAGWTIIEGQSKDSLLSFKRARGREYAHVSAVRISETNETRRRLWVADVQLY